VAATRTGEYDTDIITDFIVDKITNKGPNPLFLYASYNAPHDPWMVRKLSYDCPELFC